MNTNLIENQPPKTPRPQSPPPQSTPKTSGIALYQGHYNSMDVQPIEVMQKCLPPEQFIGFLRGNVVKYTLRAYKKDDARQEVDKVIQYANWWRQALDGKTINPREAAK